MYDYMTYAMICVYMCVCVYRHSTVVWLSRPLCISGSSDHKLWTFAFLLSFSSLIFGYGTRSTFILPPWRPGSWFSSSELLMSTLSWTSRRDDVRVRFSLRESSGKEWTEYIWRVVCWVEGSWLLVIDAASSWQSHMICLMSISPCHSSTLIMCPCHMIISSNTLSFIKLL